MPCALIFCEPTDVRSLWNEFFTHMVDDYQSTSTSTRPGFTNMLLGDLNDILIQHGKQISNYDLPSLTLDTAEDNLMPRVIQEEFLVQVPLQYIEVVHKLE